MSECKLTILPRHGARNGFKTGRDGYLWCRYNIGHGDRTRAVYLSKHRFGFS